VPDITKSDLKQNAVLWMADTTLASDEFGNRRISLPIDIKVRWESVKGEARKATAFVDREITEDSIMQLGTIVDLPTPPEKPKNLMQVVKYNEIPDVRSKFPRRFVDLVLLGTQLPPTA